MSRSDELNKSFERPASKYLEWASEDKQLRYYDKEAGTNGANVLVALPVNFVVLMERHTIKGWHDDSESGIWSNEVEDLNTEVLSVKAFKGGSIIKGLYKDIKEAVKAAGGHYCKSIYVTTGTGEIWNVSFKGSAVFAWGEFIKRDRNRLVGEIVTITGSEDKKKGKIDYSIPVFEFGAKIKANVIKKADDAYDALVESLSQRAQALAKQTDEKANDDDEDTDIEEESIDDEAMPDAAEVDF